MEPLDGNAIAGTLFDAYGAEMTTAVGRCANCGTTRQLAETRVYLRAPGTVVRCASCGAVLLVLIEIRGVMCVDARGLEALDMPQST
jgi:ribosomal protein S27E